MADCLTPRTTVRTYPPTNAQQSEVCELLPEWKDCGTCGGDFSGYDKSDSPVTYCVNGVQMIGQSLTDTPNQDNPFYGAYNVVPPTWSIMTLNQWMGSKQDQLTDSSGQPIESGACIPTCAELSAVDDKADAAQNSADAANNKQDALVGSDGNALTGGSCVVTCNSLADDFVIDPVTGQISVNFPTPSADNVVTGGSVSGTDLVLDISDGTTVTIGGLPSSSSGGIADCAEVLTCVGGSPAFTGTVDGNTPMLVSDGAGGVAQATASDFGLPASGGNSTVPTEATEILSDGSLQCVQLPAGMYQIVTTLTLDPPNQGIFRHSFFQLYVTEDIDWMLGGTSNHHYLGANDTGVDFPQEVNYNESGAGNVCAYSASGASNVISAVWRLN